MLRGNH